MLAPSSLLRTALHKSALPPATIVSSAELVEDLGAPVTFGPFHAQLG